MDEINISNADSAENVYGICKMKRYDYLSWHLSNNLCYVCTLLVILLFLFIYLLLWGSKHASCLLFSLWLLLTKVIDTKNAAAVCSILPTFSYFHFVTFKDDSKQANNRFKLS